MKVMQTLALTSALLASYMGNSFAQERTSEDTRIVLKNEQGMDLKNEENLNRYLDDHFVFPKDPQQAQTFRTLFKQLAETKIGRDTLAKMPKEKVALTCYRTYGNAGWASMNGRSYEISLQVFKPSILIHELGHIDDFSKGRGVNEWYCNSLAQSFNQEVASMHVANKTDTIAKDQAKNLAQNTVNYSNNYQNTRTIQRAQSSNVHRYRRRGLFFNWR